MKKTLSTYWPLLVGLAAAAVYFLVPEVKSWVNGLFAPKPSAQVPAPLPKGVISIDPDEITMTVIPRLPAPGTVLPGNTLVAAPDVMPTVPTKYIPNFGTYESPPFVAEGAFDMMLSAARNV